MANETVLEVKAKMRRLMVMNPHVSALQLSKVLGRDYHFVLKLHKKINAENAKRIDLGTVKKDVAYLEALVHEGSMSMRDLIFNGIDEKARVMAYDSLIKASKTLLDAKFDAGIYQKNATDVNVLVTLRPHEAELIERALAYAISRAKPTNTGGIEFANDQRELSAGAD